MKTILFIDKGERHLWESFSEHEYLFDEFLQGGELVVCDWRREGRSVYTTIPSLAAALGDEEEWNALVVTDLRKDETSLRPEDDRFFGNPYDFVENYDIGHDEPIAESQRPVIRLSQMLGGIPDRVTLEAKKVLVTEDESSGKPVVTYRYEIAHPRGEDHFDLMDRYRLGLPNPQRIVLVTPRDVDDDLIAELEMKRDFENRGAARRFWERNAYAANTRFVVCDFVAGSKRGQEDEVELSSAEAAAERAIEQRKWFGYWMAVLTLSQAEFSGDDLKPYALYRLEVGLDQQSFADVLNKRRGVWEASLDVLRTRISLELSLMDRSEYKASNMPDCTTNIPVEFDLVSSRDLEVNPKLVKLFRDKPTNDLHVWKSEHQGSVEALRDLLRAPRRGVRNAVTLFRRVSTIPERELEYCILNVYETERLGDELDAEELDLVRHTQAASFEYASYHKLVERRESQVRGTIEKRSAKVVNIAMTAVFIVMFVIGMLSFVFGGSGGNSSGANGLIAFGMVCLCCVVLAVVSYVTLVRQRDSVRDKYIAYNEMMRSIFDHMRDDANKVGSRLSRFATFKKRRMVLDRQNRKGIPTERLIWLREKHARLRKRLDRLERLSGGNDSVDRIAYRQVMKGGWSALYDMLDDEDFYLLHESDMVARPLNQDLREGQTVTVPFAFVSDVSLRQVKLYEYATCEKGAEMADGGEMA